VEVDADMGIVSNVFLDVDYIVQPAFVLGVAQRCGSDMRLVLAAARCLNCALVRRILL
jgi:hypothetical protein